jgi:hypothetical protein
MGFLLDPDFKYGQRPPPKPSNPAETPEESWPIVTSPTHRFDGSLEPGQEAPDQVRIVISPTHRFYGSGSGIDGPGDCLQQCVVPGGGTRGLGPRSQIPHYSILYDKFVINKSVNMIIHCAVRRRRIGQPYGPPSCCLRSNSAISCTPKKIFIIPSVVVGRTATRSPRNALPRGTSWPR